MASASINNHHTSAFIENSSIREQKMVANYANQMKRELSTNNLETHDGVKFNPAQWLYGSQCDDAQFNSQKQQRPIPNLTPAELTSKSQQNQLHIDNSADDNQCCHFEDQFQHQLDQGVCGGGGDAHPFSIASSSLTHGLVMIVSNYLRLLSSLIMLFLIHRLIYMFCSVELAED